MTSQQFGYDTSKIYFYRNEIMCSKTKLTLRNDVKINNLATKNLRPCLRFIEALIEVQADKGRCHHCMQLKPRRSPGGASSVLGFRNVRCAS